MQFVETVKRNLSIKIRIQKRSISKQKGLKEFEVTDEDDKLNIQCV